MLELLAPAGSMESLRAAVQNGANAVYLGCGTFNARQGAKNFTPQTLTEEQKAQARANIGAVCVTDYIGTEYAGKLLYIADDGTIQPLAVGAGLKIVNGVLMLVSGSGETVTIEAQIVDGQYVLSDSNGNTITPAVSADGLLTWPGVSVSVDGNGTVIFTKE